MRSPQTASIIHLINSLTPENGAEKAASLERIIQQTQTIAEKNQILNDSVNDTGSTPLMCAINKGEAAIPIILMLIKHGANIELPDNNCQTALDHASLFDAENQTNLYAIIQYAVRNRSHSVASDKNEIKKLDFQGNLRKDFPVKEALTGYIDHLITDFNRVKESLLAEVRPGDVLPIVELIDIISAVSITDAHISTAEYIEFIFLLKQLRQIILGPNVTQLSKQALLSKLEEIVFGTREDALVEDGFDVCFMEPLGTKLCVAIAHKFFPDQKPLHVLLKRSLTEGRPEPWHDTSNFKFTELDCTLTHPSSFLRNSRGIHTFEDLGLKAISSLCALEQETKTATPEDEGRGDIDKMWYETDPQNGAPRYTPAKDIPKKSPPLSDHDKQRVSERSPILAQLMSYSEKLEKWRRPGKKTTLDYLQLLQKELEDGSIKNKTGNAKEKFAGDEGYLAGINFRDWWMQLDDKTQLELCKLYSVNTSGNKVSFGFILTLIGIPATITTDEVVPESRSSVPFCLAIQSANLEAILQFQPPNPVEKDKREKLLGRDTQRPELPEPPELKDVDKKKGDKYERWKIALTRALEHHQFNIKVPSVFEALEEFPQFIIKQIQDETYDYSQLKTYKIIIDVLRILNDLERITNGLPRFDKDGKKIKETVDYNKRIITFIKTIFSITDITALLLLFEHTKDSFFFSCNPYFVQVIAFRIHFLQSKRPVMASESQSPVKTMPPGNLLRSYLDEFVKDPKTFKPLLHVVVLSEDDNGVDFILSAIDATSAPSLPTDLVPKIKIGTYWDYWLNGQWCKVRVGAISKDILTLEVEDQYVDRIVSKIQNIALPVNKSLFAQYDTYTHKDFDKSNNKISRRNYLLSYLGKIHLSEYAFLNCNAKVFFWLRQHNIHTQFVFSSLPISTDRGWYFVLELIKRRCFDLRRVPEIWEPLCFYKPQDVKFDKRSIAQTLLDKGTPYSTLDAIRADCVEVFSVCLEYEDPFLMVDSGCEKRTKECEQLMLNRVHKGESACAILYASQEKNKSFAVKLALEAIKANKKDLFFRLWKIDFIKQEIKKLKKPFIFKDFLVYKGKELKIGMYADVFTQDRWRWAQIINQGKYNVLVHYLGWDSKFDEEIVANGRVASFKTEAKNSSDANNNYQDPTRIEVDPAVVTALFSEGSKLLSWDDLFTITKPEDGAYIFGLLQEVNREHISPDALSKLKENVIRADKLDKKDEILQRLSELYVDLDEIIAALEVSNVDKLNFAIKKHNTPLAGKDDGHGNEVKEHEEKYVEKVKEPELVFSVKGEARFVEALEKNLKNKLWGCFNILRSSFLRDLILKNMGSVLYWVIFNNNENVFDVLASDLPEAGGKVGNRDTTDFNVLLMLRRNIGLIKKLIACRVEIDYSLLLNSAENKEDFDFIYNLLKELEGYASIPDSILKSFIAHVFCNHNSAGIRDSIFDWITQSSYQVKITIADAIAHNAPSLIEYLLNKLSHKASHADSTVTEVVFTEQDSKIICDAFLVQAQKNEWACIVFCLKRFSATQLQSWFKGISFPLLKAAIKFNRKDILEFIIEFVPDAERKNTLDEEDYNALRKNGNLGILEPLLQKGFIESHRKLFFPRSAVTENLVIDLFAANLFIEDFLDEKSVVDLIFAIQQPLHIERTETVKLSVQPVVSLLLQRVKKVRADDICMVLDSYPELLPDFLKKKLTLAVDSTEHKAEASGILEVISDVPSDDSPFSGRFCDQLSRLAQRQEWSTIFVYLDHYRHIPIPQNLLSDLFSTAIGQRNSNTFLLFSSRNIFPPTEMFKTWKFSIEIASLFEKYVCNLSKLEQKWLQIAFLRIYKGVSGKVRHADCLKDQGFIYLCNYLKRNHAQDSITLNAFNLMWAAYPEICVTGNIPVRVFSNTYTFLTEKPGRRASFDKALIEGKDNDESMRKLEKYVADNSATSIFDKEKSVVKLFRFFYKDPSSIGAAVPEKNSQQQLLAMQPFNGGS